MKLRQKKSVIEYYEEFDAIITRLNLSEEYLLSYFLGGLKKDIQMMVRMFQPTTVNKAFSLARLYEAANTSGSVSNEINKQQKGVLGHRPLSVDNSSSSSTGTNASRIKARSGKSLTPAYMDERRAKGLCYFCDDPYSPEHSLTHKKLQVHVLEIDDEDDQWETMANVNDRPTVGEPQISVNALTGVASFRTMRITGYYKKKPLHILIDSGGFVNTGLAM
uniref:Ty3 transposon capsid-like protein domain-containing protein n=1 Tax=Cajanus cajan TaxID=3821 RepID=A0A151U9U9_CAJCA|nr:hypothetical protein KK1_020273 [Cajanus cajan]